MRAGYRVQGGVNAKENRYKPKLIIIKQLYNPPHDFVADCRGEFLPQYIRACKFSTQIYNNSWGKL